MTDFRAIAAVTAAFTERVSDAISGVIPMAGTTNLRPTNAVSDVSPPSVNVFLYRAVPNASLRNASDPVRDSGGNVIRQPTAAWDLHYLLTFVGDESQLEPELLMGAVVTTLTAGAALERGFVAAVDASLAAETDSRALAAGSGLQEQAHLVKLGPIDMSVETMAQLWGSLTNDGYALSLAYEASVVMMSAKLSPAPALAVGGPPALAVAPAGSPTITAIRNVAGAGHPIFIRSTLVIEGRGLAGPNVQVRIGALDVDIADADVSASRIVVPLSPEVAGTPVPLALAPGIMGVQVRHLIDVSADPLTPELRPGPASNTAAITLRPEIGTPTVDTDADGDAAIALTLSPEADESWRYTLLLNRIGAGTVRALTLEQGSVLPATTSPPAPARVLFKSAVVPSGDWLVRLQVNGADSLLTVDSSGDYAEPRVTI